MHGHTAVTGGCRPPSARDAVEMHGAFGSLPCWCPQRVLEVTFLSCPGIGGFASPTMMKPGKFLIAILAASGNCTEWEKAGGEKRCY